MAGDPQEFSVSDLLKHEQTQSASVVTALPVERYSFNTIKSIHWQRFWFRHQKIALILPLSFIFIFCFIQTAIYFTYPVVTVITSDTQNTEKLSVIKNLDRNELWLAIHSNKKPKEEFVFLESIELTKNKFRFIVEDEMNKEQLLVIKNSILSYFNNVSEQNIYQKELLLKKQIDLLRSDLKGLSPSNDSDYYLLKSKSDLKNYIQYGETSLMRQRQYYGQIILIEEYARHNVVDVFKLRKKELEVPLLSEIKNLITLIKSDQDGDHKSELLKLKMIHAKFVKELLEKEIDEVSEKYLTPARKKLIKKETKLSELWFEWQVSQGLYEVYRDRIHNNNSNVLKDLSIKSKLILAQKLFDEREKLILNRLHLNRIDLHLNYHFEKPTISLLAFSVALIGFVLIYGAFIFVKIKNETELTVLGSPEEFQEKFKPKQALLALKSSNKESKIELLNSSCSRYYLNYFEQNKLLNDNCAVHLWCFDPFLKDDGLIFPVESVLAAAKNNLKVCFMYTNDKHVFSNFDDLDRSVKEGFVNYMDGANSLEECVYATNVENVYLMPVAGRIKDHFDMNAKWNELKKIFDVIIISNKQYHNGNMINIFSEKLTQINCIVSNDTEQNWVEILLNDQSLKPSVSIQPIFVIG